MADVSKRSAKVNLTGIYGNMAFGPLGLAVMSVNGHPVNPLSDVLMSGQARQTMFQPLKQQGSYEVTYNVTTGELENADTVEAQEAPLATEDVDPLDQYEEDVADFDNPPGPPPDDGEGPDDGSRRGRALYEKMKRKDIASEALQNAQDKRAQLRAQTRKQRRETQQAIVESLLAGNPVIIQEPGLRREEQIQNLREYYIDQFGGLGIRRVNPDDLRNYRRTGVSTATVEEVVGEPVINSAAAREVPEGPIPIPENIQSMAAFVRAQDRAERRARLRERQFANLMASSQPSLQQKRQYNQDKIATQRERLVSQSRRAERQAVRIVSADVSNDVDNDNRLLAQVARAEDETQALRAENRFLQSERYEAPEAIIYRPFVNPLVPIIEDRDIRQTARYQEDLQQSRQQQIASNRMDDYIIALDAYRRGNRPVAPRDPRVDESSGTRLDPRIIQRQQLGQADIEFHESGYHRNPQEINEASPEQVESYLQMQQMAQGDNASFEIQNAFGRFTTALISRAIVGNRRQNQQEPRSRIQDEARMQRNLEAANILSRFRDERGFFPDDTRVLQILETTINRYRQHQAMPGIRGMNELVRLYGEFVDAYNAEREQQRQNLRTVAQRNQAIDDNNDLLLGRNPYNPQEPD